MARPRSSPRAARLAAFLAASAALHGAIAWAVRVEAPVVEARTGLAAATASAESSARPAIATAARADLVRRAREDVARGALDLGAFLLDANAIDAREEGVPFDRAAAGARLKQRIALLEAQMFVTDSVAEAVANAFADPRYAGVSGGRMGDTLLTRAHGSRSAPRTRRARPGSAPRATSRRSRRSAPRTAARRELLLATQGRPWVLLFLDDTDALVGAMADDVADTYAEVLTVAGLVVTPRTRADGLRRANAMRPERRVDVMHEIFRAHERMRPWASSYALETEPGSGGDFERIYRVMRPIGWRLWEAPRPPADAIETLVVRSREAGLGREDVEALASYYARNFVGLKLRPNGVETTRELDRALAAHGLPQLSEMPELALTPSELDALGGR